MWGHYSKALQRKIEARIDFASSIHDNPIKLGEAIKECALSFEETRYKIAAVANTL